MNQTQVNVYKRGSAGERGGGRSVNTEAVGREGLKDFLVGR